MCTISNVFSDGVIPELAGIVAAMLAGAAAVFGETRSPDTKRLTLTGYLVLIGVLGGTTAAVVVTLRNRAEAEASKHAAAAAEAEVARFREQQARQLRAIESATSKPRVVVADRIAEINRAFFQIAYAWENVDDQLRSELQNISVVTVAQLSPASRASLQRCCYPVLQLSILDTRQVSAARAVEIVTFEPIQLRDIQSVDADDDLEVNARITYDAVALTIAYNSGDVGFVEDLVGTTAVVRIFSGDATRSAAIDRVDQVVLVTSAGRRIAFDQLTFRQPFVGTAEISEKSIR